jgi:glycosyltransferase involved in cell wall biosynthesis
LDAFRELAPEMPSLHVYLVGKGPDETALKEAYSTMERVHFLGWREDIPQLLRSADLLVLPSKKEAFGLVLPEAMVSGVAVIATNSGGARDIIQNGRTGILVPPENVEALANAIRDVLLNPSKKRDLEVAARLDARARFSAERMARETAEVYAKTLT